LSSFILQKGPKKLATQQMLKNMGSSRGKYYQNFQIFSTQIKNIFLDLPLNNKFSSQDN
jgi:hypothetical protein